MLNRFNSNARKLNRIIPKINPNNLNDDLYITGSLLNIELPTSNKFNSKTKSNSASTKIVNNKKTIENFHQEILEHSARTIVRQVNEFDSGSNTLTIYNVHTDYGTEGASPNNFEVLVFGLHIPGDYIIEDTQNDVVITLGNSYIDFENTLVSDIYVIGKLVDVPIAAENNTILSTENDLDLII
jgi:hypothetical protein